jgi:hypothetical protein
MLKSRKVRTWRLNVGKKKEEYVWDLTEVPDTQIIAEAGRRRRKMARARPKVMHPCKHCGKLFGAAEVRKHWPVCPKKPIRGTAKKKGGA